MNFCSSELLKSTAILTLPFCNIVFMLEKGLNRVIYILYKLLVSTTFDQQSKHNLGPMLVPALHTLMQSL